MKKMGRSGKFTLPSSNKTPKKKSDKVKREVPDDLLVITSMSQATLSKEEFLANPPKKISFRLPEQFVVNCTLIGEKEDRVAYLVEVGTNMNILTIVYIFKKKSRCYRRVLKSLGIAEEWQTVSVDTSRCTDDVRQYRIALELIHFEIFGFGLFSEEDF